MARKPIPPRRVGPISPYPSPEYSFVGQSPGPRRKSKTRSK